MSEGLRVLVVTPSYLPDLTGNAITAQRLYKGLSGRGAEVRVTVGDNFNEPDFRPDIIHALHARKGGVPALELSERFEAPFVITITGTDQNIDLHQPEREDVLRVLERAAAVITYSETAREGIISALPGISGKVRVIRPGVDICEPKGRNSCIKPGFNFLLPAGIRKVKDPSFAAGPLEALRKDFPDINLTIAGAVIDEGEWKRLSGIIKGRDWISHRLVPHEEMPDLYLGSDVVLNTSMSEGLSNTILEAMCFGRAVLASDCEGNRSVVSDGVDGLLYRLGDGEDFIKKAGMLICDPGLRERLGSAARDKVLREYSPDAEIEGHLRLYLELLGCRL